MKQSFLPKPLLFKEWKEYRWWMFAALILFLYRPLASLQTLLQAQHSPNGTNILLWKVLTPTLYHFEYMPDNQNYPVPHSYIIHGQPTISVFSVLVSMGLTIALITVERNRGTWRYTLSFPIRRQDLLRVKIVLALAIVCFGFLVQFAFLAICDVAVGHAIPMTVLYQWFGENLLFAVTLMGIGFACASVIQMGPLAGITALILAAFPWALGVSVQPSMPTNTGVNMNPLSVATTAGVNSLTTPAQHISLFLRSLSPTSFFAGSSGGGGTFPNQQLVMQVNWGHPLHIGLILWFIFVALASGALGFLAYLRAPVENSGRWVQFPRLDVAVILLFDAAISLFICFSVFSNHSAIKNTPYLLTIYWFVTWAVIGALVVGARKFRRRERKQTAVD